jgi:hypothetical protein
VGEDRGSVRRGTCWVEAERLVRAGGIIKVQNFKLHHPLLVDMVGERVVFRGLPEDPKYAGLFQYEDEGAPVLRVGGTRRRYSLVLVAGDVPGAVGYWSVCFWSDPGIPRNHTCRCESCIP